MDELTEKMSRPAYHHGDLREALIKATQRLIEEKGIDQFSVSDACRLAGVSTAAPYKHFKDRDALLTTVAFDCLIEMQTRTTEILSQYEEGSIEGIVAISRNYISFATENPNIFKLMFSLTRSHSKDDEMMEKAPEGFRLVRKAVGAYFGCGENDKLAVDRSFMIWSFVHGLSFIVIDEKSDAVGVRLDLDDVIENGIRSLLARPFG